MYGATGIQLMEINGLYGLMAYAASRPEVFARADRMQMIPDVFHRLLSGTTVTVYTAATTSGAFDVAAGEWSWELLEELGVPTGLLPDVAPPGTDVGPVIGDLGEQGLRGTRVILPASTTPLVPCSPYRGQPPERCSSRPAPGRWWGWCTTGR